MGSSMNSFSELWIKETMHALVDSYCRRLHTITQWPQGRMCFMRAEREMERAWFAAGK